MAAGGFRRTGRFRAQHHLIHREHVVRVAFGRMRLSDKDGTHELMGTPIENALYRIAGVRASLTASRVFSWFAMTAAVCTDA